MAISGSSDEVYYFFTPLLLFNVNINREGPRTRRCFYVFKGGANGATSHTHTQPTPPPPPQGVLALPASSSPGPQSKAVKEKKKRRRRTRAEGQEIKEEPHT